MMINTANLTILHVEDDEIDLETVQRAFKKNDVQCNVVTASDGLQAWELLTGTASKPALSPSPDILLLDVNMPRLNGLELLARIREHHQLHSVLVYMLTTSDAERDVVRAHELNVAGYLNKPIRYPQLCECIRALDKHWSYMIFTKP